MNFKTPSNSYHEQLDLEHFSSNSQVEDLLSAYHEPNHQSIQHEGHWPELGICRVRIRKTQRTKKNAQNFEKLVQNFEVRNMEEDILQESQC